MTTPIDEVDPFAEILGCEPTEPQTVVVGPQPIGAQPQTIVAEPQPATKAPVFEAPTDQVELPNDVCPNCLAQTDSEIEFCENCGYYARFGVVVGGEEDGEEDKPFPLLSVAAMAAVFSAVAMYNIAVLFFTPHGSPERAWWSVLQLLLGALAASTAHIFCFLKKLDSDNDVGLLDFVLRPFASWVDAAKKLPKRLWMFLLFVGGITAVLGALLVTRNIPMGWLYEASDPWELDENIQNAIEQAEAEQEAVNLPTQDSNAGLYPPPEFKPDPTRIYKDAVVVAYWTDADGVVERVLMAAAIEKRLQQVGIVYDIPQGARRKLTEELPSIGRSTPFLAGVSVNENGSAETNEGGSNKGSNPPSGDTATATETNGDGTTAASSSGVNWVQPRWLCRVSWFEEEENIPTDLQFHWVVRQLRSKISGDKKPTNRSQPNRLRSRPRENRASYTPDPIQLAEANLSSQDDAPQTDSPRDDQHDDSECNHQ